MENKAEEILKEFEPKITHLGCSGMYSKDQVVEMIQIASQQKPEIAWLSEDEIERMSDNFIKTYFYPDIQAKGECDQSDEMKSFVKNWLQSKLYKNRDNERHE